MKAERERLELLSLALMCMRLIDAAIHADRSKKADWWPESETFDYGRTPSYAKTYVVCEVMGDKHWSEHAAELQALGPREAIAVLHKIQMEALFYSSRGVPRPDLSSLTQKAEGES